MTSRENDYYVYLMFDPENGEKPFYVGKGKGDRASMHMKASEDWYNSRKAAVMKRLRAENKVPNIACVPMPSEEKAIEFEKTLIKHFGRKHIDEGGCLTNLAIDANPPSRKGKPGTFLGRKHSEATKQKIRETLARKRAMMTQEERSKKYDSTKNGRRTDLRAN